MDDQPRRERPSDFKMASLESDLRNLITRLDERYLRDTEKLDRIDGQTQLTNGRVNNLESWKDKAVGAWFVIVILSSVAAFFMGKIGLNADAKAQPAPTGSAWAVKLDDSGNPQLCTSPPEGHPYCIPLQSGLTVKR